MSHSPRPRPPSACRRVGIGLGASSTWLRSALLSLTRASPPVAGGLVSLRNALLSLTVASPPVAGGLVSLRNALLSLTVASPPVARARRETLQEGRKYGRGERCSDSIALRLHPLPIFRPSCDFSR